MANICGGALAIECSSKEKLELILNAFDGSRNGVLELSFDGLLDALDVEDKSFCDTRGTFESPELKEMDCYYALVMNFNCKWSFSTTILDAISNVHNDLTFEYLQEECGNCIFVNTDTEGKYFVDRYYLYIEEKDSYYFSNDEEDKVFATIKEELFPDIVLNNIEDCKELNRARRLANGYEKNIGKSNEEEVLSICQKLFPNSKINEYEDCPVVKNEMNFFFFVFEEA